ARGHAPLEGIRNGAHRLQDPAVGGEVRPAAAGNGLDDQPPFGAVAWLVAPRASHASPESTTATAATCPTRPTLSVETYLGSSLGQRVTARIAERGPRQDPRLIGGAECAHLSALPPSGPQLGDRRSPGGDDASGGRDALILGVDGSALLVSLADLAVGIWNLG